MTPYQLTASDVVIRKRDGANIPMDERNKDYRDYLAAGGDTNADPFVPVPEPPPTILAQDLMAQFTTDDLTKIKAAVDGNIQLWGLWSAMQAQSAPMVVTNARFLTGWAALTHVLGAPRMAAIAAALGVTIS